MAGDMKCEILDTLLEFPEERGYHLELNLIKWDPSNGRHPIPATKY